MRFDLVWQWNRKSKFVIFVVRGNVKIGIESLRVVEPYKNGGGSRQFSESRHLFIPTFL
jgi:hypothetical protein